MLVTGINEILRDYAATHFQAGDVAVESASHLWSSEAAGGSQVACDKAAMFFQRVQYHGFDAVIGYELAATAPPVSEVRPK